MTKLFVIAEKKEQASAYAKGLDGTVTKPNNYIWKIENSTVLNDYSEILVGCLQGHVYELDNPEKYDAKWSGKWDYKKLPIIIPHEDYSYHIKPNMKSRLLNIKKLLSGCDELWLATDSDTEGELLGYEVLEQLKIKNRLTKRVLPSSLTKEGVKNAFLNYVVDPQTTYGKYLAGKVRSYVDWLIGMNYTELATTLLSEKGFYSKTPYSVGRVQTPVIKLINENRKIRINFKSTSSYRSKLVVEQDGLTFNSDKSTSIPDKVQAQTRLNNIKELVVDEVTVDEKQKSAPKLFVTGDIQGILAEIYNMEPSAVVDDVLEDMYNTMHITTYPRTSMNLITKDEFDSMKANLENYAYFAKFVLNVDVFDDFVNTDYRKKYVDFNGKKVSKAGHSGLHLDMPISPDVFDGLSNEQKKAYVDIYTHALGIFMPDFKYKEITIKAHDIDHEENIFIGKIKDSSVFDEENKNSFYKLYKKIPKFKVNNGFNLSKYKKGSHLVGFKKELQEDKTQIPPAITKASIVRTFMPKYKLGTSATQGQIVKGLEDKGYIKASAKKDAKLNLIKNEYEITEKSQNLLDLMRSSKLLELTNVSHWQDQLDNIIDETQEPSEVLTGIESLIKHDVSYLPTVQTSFTNKPNKTKNKVKVDSKTKTDLKCFKKTCKGTFEYTRSTITMENGKMFKANSYICDTCHEILPATIGSPATPTKLTVDDYRTLFKDKKMIHNFMFINKKDKSLAQMKVEIQLKPKAKKTNDKIKLSFINNKRKKK